MLLYAIVDAAKDRRLYDLVQSCAEHVCLFSGKLEHPLPLVAPYLVRLDEHSELMEAWRAYGWGQSWGLLFFSEAELEQLRRHLRQFLQAKLSDGRIVLFRFYDPRVWRTYISSCTPKEAEQFFGPVSIYRAETQDGTATLQYRFVEGQVTVDTLR